MSTSRKIHCLVVDDEMPAREILKKHISGVEFLDLTGSCCNAMEANSFLQTNTIDLIFLDIQMPKLLGTKFVRALRNPPRIIFTTAYRKFAVEGFELDAVDYLLKPISFDRFLKSVNKVLNLTLENTDSANQEYASSSAANPFFYFRCDRKMVKIFLSDILYIEGMKDYIKVVTNTKVIVTKHVLSTMDEMLPKNQFLRIHRSFIVALEKVESFNSDFLEISGKRLPLGRLFKHGVLNVLKSKV